MQPENRAARKILVLPYYGSCLARAPGPAVRVGGAAGNLTTYFKTPPSPPPRARARGRAPGRGESPVRAAGFTPAVREPPASSRRLARKRRRRPPGRFFGEPGGHARHDTES